jgi:hypothetical protein
VIPLAISRQNSRSTSLRCDGAPGDFIGDRPVNSFIHPAGLPINTSIIEVLQRPVESTQYTSTEFTDLLTDHKMIQSLSRPRQCWDNAVAESFFASLKLECIYHQALPTRAHARRAVFDYIEVFFNRRRLHSSLGYLTPAAYENKIRNRNIAHAA